MSPSLQERNSITILLRGWWCNNSCLSCDITSSLLLVLWNYQLLFRGLIHRFRTGKRLWVRRDQGFFNWSTSTNCSSGSSAKSALLCREATVIALVLWEEVSEVIVNSCTAFLKPDDFSISWIFDNTWVLKSSRTRPPLPVIPYARWTPLVNRHEVLQKQNAQKHSCDLRTSLLGASYQSPPPSPSQNWNPRKRNWILDVETGDESATWTFPLEVSFSRLITRTTTFVIIHARATALSRTTSPVAVHSLPRSLFPAADDIAMRAIGLKPFIKKRDKTEMACPFNHDLLLNRKR